MSENEMNKAFSRWAWMKKGEPVGLMGPNQAAREAFEAGFRLAQSTAAPACATLELERALALATTGVDGVWHWGTPDTGAGAVVMSRETLQRWIDATPREVRDDDNTGDEATRTRWLVFVRREDLATDTPTHVAQFFADEGDARDFFELASANWSDSFLCTVIVGPGPRRPKPQLHDRRPAAPTENDE